MMLVRTALLAALVAMPLSPLAAQDYKIEDVPDAVKVGPSDLKPKVIVYSDHREDPLAIKDLGLIRFDAWERERPLQQKQLSLWSTYGQVASATSGTSETPAKPPVPENPYMYLVEARFVIPRAATSVDLARFATLAFVEQVDPAIKHKTMTGADVASEDRNPERAWCEGGVTAICIQSRYEFEGQIPMGIRLANKITETAKKLPDSLLFQSELRLLSPDEIARRELGRLTGLDTPVAGAIEQSIFQVNHVLQFGKFLAVLQPHPADANKSIATAYMALAIKASVLERKREYEKMPILRNLVPAQVLMGKSSFNSGKSISAGLPAYARNQIIAIAGILEKK